MINFFATFDASLSERLQIGGKKYIVILEDFYNHFISKQF